MADGKLKSVYFIYGPHRLLLKDAVKRLSDQIIGGGDSRALDVVKLSGGEDNAARILAECQTLSFFGNKRLIVVAGPLSMRAEDQKKLIPYIDNPNPQTILVFSQETEDQQLKRRLKGNKIFSACKTAGDAGVAEYEIKSGVGSWIKSSLADRGKQAEQPVINYLLQWIGTDLDRLSAEIAKICDAAGDKDDIDMQLCRDVVVTAGEPEVYDYIGAVVDRDREKALGMLEPLLDRESMVGNTFALLERQFLLMLQAKAERLRGHDLAKSLSVKPGQAYYVEKQSRLFSSVALRRALELLVEADQERKSRPTPTRIILERLTVDLCGLQ